MKGPIHGPFDHRFNIKSLIRNYRQKKSQPIGVVAGKKIDSESGGWMGHK